MIRDLQARGERVSNPHLSNLSQAGDIDTVPPTRPVLFQTSPKRKRGTPPPVSRGVSPRRKHSQPSASPSAAAVSTSCHRLTRSSGLVGIVHLRRNYRQRPTARHLSALSTGSSGSRGRGAIATLPPKSSKRHASSGSRVSRASEVTAFINPNRVKSPNTM